MAENFGRHLGIDLGDRRTGLAVCDDLGMMAHPLTVIDETDRARLVEKILAICAEEEIAGIVLGWPVNMDGSEGSRAELSRQFAALLQAAGGPPVTLEDERLSSWEAEGRLIAAGVKPGKRKGKLDAAAAQTILQSFLDRENPRHKTDPTPHNLPPHKPPRRR